MAARTLSTIGGACLLAAALHGPAAAGNCVQVVPLASDDRGDRAWVEIDSAGNRMKATPFVAVGDERLRKAIENPVGKETVAVPVPRLMRLVERARRALRDMKRPDGKTPAGADAAAPAPPAAMPAGPLGPGPPRASPLAPPAKTGAAIRPPAELFGAAGG